MIQPAFRSILLTVSLALPAHAAAEACQGWLERGFWAEATPEAVESCEEIKTPDAKRTEVGETVLHLAAAESDDPAVVRALLAAGADPNRTRRDGRTPLHFAAAEATEPGVVIALVFAGAEVDALFAPGDDWLGEPGTRALHLAAQRPDGQTVVAALISAGADLSTYDAEGRTVLHHAARSDPDARLVELLLVAGADPNSKDNDGWTPLHMAAEWSTVPPVILALLEKGGDPDSENNNEALPLHRAAANTAVPRVFDLLAADSQNACEPLGSGANAVELADNNPALKGTPEYWALHDRCAKAED